jgi:membrane protein involved in colicin uptake
VQGGDSHAEGFGISILIPKNFRHESFEAEETAKELTTKAAKAKAAKVKAEAKDESTAKNSAAVNKQAGTKQKIKKQAPTDIKQKTAAAPAKEDAKRCTVSFPGALVVLVSAALFFAVTMALRSNSSVSTGAPAEVVTTKAVSSWASGLYDNNVRNDFCAVQEAFETTCSVRPSRHLNPRLDTS